MIAQTTLVAVPSYIVTKHLMIVEHLTECFGPESQKLEVLAWIVRKELSLKATATHEQKLCSVLHSLVWH